MKANKRRMPPPPPGADVVVVTALHAEGYAISAALPDALDILRTGMGLKRAARMVARLEAPEGHPVAVAGFAGSLVDGVGTGEVVVASEVVDPQGTRTPLPAGAPLVAELRRRGITVHYGPIASAEHIVHGAERRRLAERTGAIAVDMESSAVVATLAGRHPVTVMRVIADSPSLRLLSPAMVPGSVRAYRTLRAASEALQEWAAAAGRRRVVLAAPRSFCAGVERAISVVERALERSGGAPVYVRKQIVHNAHVVANLESRGAVFVDELDAVPAGATVIFSAHGVSPEVRETAIRRDLRVIDATCPLVSKVHAEARRYAGRGDTVLLIGHAGHEETEGTLGEARESIRLVQTAQDAATVDVPDPDRVSYVMQTTLAVDEAADIVGVLEQRFPLLSGPSSDDICYATTNRQDAVRAVAAESQLVLVVGSANSANSTRLVEVAERSGAAARRIDDETGIEPGWLHGVATVGLTAGASAPPPLVDKVIATLAALGPVEVVERLVTVEDLEFTLPKEVS